MQRTYQHPNSEYSSSEKAVIDVLNNAQRDLCPAEIAEECEYSASTLVPVLKDLEDEGKVINTRTLSQTNFYESRSKRQLKYNLRYSQNNGEEYVRDFVLDTLEYAKQDISVPQLADVSGFSQQHLCNVIDDLVEEGLVEQTRKVSHTHLYTTTSQ